MGPWRLIEPAPVIAVVGSTMIDLISYAPRIPDAGETIVGTDFRMGFGGKGANQAVMARLLGARVAMVNALGRDAYGDMTLANFAAFGIDTTYVSQVDRSSGVAPIWVEPDGTNRIICVPGANNEITPGAAVDAIRSLDGLRVVVGQLEIPQAVTVAAFTEARRRSVITMLNPAPAAALRPELVRESDWIIPNEHEFALLSGRSAEARDDDLRAFAAETGGRLLVTLGARGAALLDMAGRVQRIPAGEVTALDTTGAGDAFIGAFAFGLAAGLDDLAAVGLGVACASDSVTRLGTQSSFPAGDRARAFLEQEAV